MAEHRREPRRRVSIWWMVAFLFAAGCGARSTTTAEEDHLEHHVPPHRPATFSAGLEAIRTRLTQVAAGPQGPDAALWQQQTTELREILEWLPELAGDSDLRRPAWEQVHDVSRQMLIRYRTRVEGTPAELSKLASELLPLLDSLEPLKGTEFDRMPGADEAGRPEEAEPRAESAAGSSPDGPSVPSPHAGDAGDPAAANGTPLLPTAAVEPAPQASGTNP